MREIDWSRAGTTPRVHQQEGVQALLMHDNPGIGRVYQDCFALMDQVGAGKSKQVIDTSEILFADDKEIETVVVVAPAFARGVWASPIPALGEVAKHGWPSITNDIIEYSVRSKPKDLTRASPRGALRWIVTNYELIRRDARLDPLFDHIKDQAFALICDEAWSLKDAQTDQWKAVNYLRQRAKRIWELNGTPVADTPLDLFAQMKLLHPGILATRYINKWGKPAWTGFIEFRARYALLKPNVNFPMIEGWQNLEELRDKVRPYVLARKTRDCFDLPPILEPVLIEAKLSDENWSRYRSMRDDTMVWLGKQGDAETVSVARHAFVKTMRLAQITSGFIGGVQEIDFDEDGTKLEQMTPIQPLVEIGREKLDAMLAWLKTTETPKRLLVWSKFRPEVERTARVLGEFRRTYKLYGQQPQSEREAAKAALNPEIEQADLVAVVGNAEAGGAALNLAGASLAVTLSLNPKLRVMLQAAGRIDRPGQTQPIRYANVVATGPRGQRTIDHTILAAILGKEDIAKWTAATWRTRLEAEY